MTKYQKRRNAAHRERVRQQRIQGRVYLLEGSELDEFLSVSDDKGNSNRDFLIQMGAEAGQTITFDLGDGPFEFVFPG